MSDIVFDNLVFDRLREIGDQRDRIAALEDEIARLRLTDAEREAINVAQNLMAGTAHAKAFGSLLERTGGGETWTES